mmetsp:Transcript_8048/g.9235  ORF Transcript_8048/g.9235 Transcript_8048/m.9235 type:complete len:247 (-) Transcript_8048:1259-1999(-)|eukprot:CAMPEP_0184032184 /NCGR_PEP_ID=MMETSP0955-20130417/2817_1 /TAXON_ID=627963 /ORGANISM="Aplanochytrium sp, Strain PBS07" /LENGTH=246 /DNA_ID=CAMNT_0026318155 /DNA_START=433 /DNA_END=1173 /DNA_ORIENTATION=-
MPASTERTAKPKKKTTREVFYEFIKRDRNGVPDVSAIFDKECFEAWLRTRTQQPQKPGESYRRALVSQLTASDGRRPFEQDVEEKILARIRQKKRWPCFHGTKTTIGQHGCKRKGFHEAKKEQKKQRIMKTVAKEAAYPPVKRKRVEGTSNAFSQEPLVKRTSLDVFIPPGAMLENWDVVDPFSNFYEQKEIDLRGGGMLGFNADMDPLPYDGPDVHPVSVSGLYEEDDLSFLENSPYPVSMYETM